MMELLFLPFAWTIIAKGEPGFGPYDKNLYLIASFLAWMKVIAMLKSLMDPFAIFIYTLEKIIEDVLPFMLVLGILLAMFIHMFYICEAFDFKIYYDGDIYDDDENVTNSSVAIPPRRLRRRKKGSGNDEDDGLVTHLYSGDDSIHGVKTQIQQILLLFFGVMDDDIGNYRHNQEAPESTIDVVVFFFFLMIMVIIMQNILVAVCCDSFEESMEITDILLWKSTLKSLRKGDQLIKTANGMFARIQAQICPKNTEKDDDDVEESYSYLSLVYETGEALLPTPEDVFDEECEDWEPALATNAMLKAVMNKTLSRRSEKMACRISREKEFDRMAQNLSECATKNIKAKKARMKVKDSMKKK